MWSKRKDEESDRISRPAQPAYAPVADPAVTSRPIRTYDGKPTTEGGVSSFARNIIIKGQIISGENLVVDGDMEGSIECPEHRLTIGPNARVQASLKAREILILGAVHGNVDALDKIELKKEAKLAGDIRTNRLVIEDGAHFKGNIHMAETPAVAPVVPIDAASRTK